MLTESLSAGELELSSIAARCVLGYGGLVLDLGDEVAGSLQSFHLTAEVSPKFSNRLGESFRQLDQMQNSFVFWLPDDLTDFEIDARVHGLESERLAIYIDNERIGAAKLKSGETRVVRIDAKNRVIAKGRHELTLSLSRPRGNPPGVEISWLRLGEANRRLEDFPPSRREIFSEVTVGKQRHASVILPPGASLRCPIRLGKQARLVTEVGLWGQGLGELEVIVHSQSQGRIVVEKLRREKADKRDFLPLNVDLSRFSGELLDLELRAPHRAPGARIALARPKLTSKPEVVSNAPPGHRAIVVLLSGLGAEHSPPQAGENGLPFLNQLALEGTLFPNYRVSTTSAPGALASLFTGQAPYVHQLEDTLHELSSKTTTIASAIESRGGRTSFFTSVPTGFSNLGFDRGFETFHAVPPQSDVDPNQVIALAQEWLSTRLLHPGPLLTVIQLRGAHPPFDIPNEAADELGPAEYGGELTPRRAALQLSEIRNRRRTEDRRMPPEDWQRLEALKKAALLKQSSALSHLVAWLREREAYEDTLLVVLGDIGAGERPLIPFSEKPELREEYLAVPLVIKFPHAFRGGAQILGRFAPRDITKTLLVSLGLSDLEGFDGIDLGASDADERVKDRPHIAYRDGEYSLEYQGKRLWGHDGRAPKLCDPSLDPQCHDDRADQQVMTSRALWMLLANELGKALTEDRKGADVSEDLDFENSLIVWGEAR